MSGFRVQLDLHHTPDQADGRVWMLVFNGWQVWRLTDEELREHHAAVGLSLARLDMAQPIDGAVPFDDIDAQRAEAGSNPW